LEKLQLSFASASADAKIKIWDFNKNLLSELGGHTGTVTSLKAWKDDFLISGSNDGSVRVWSTSQMFCVSVVTLSDARVRSIRILENNFFACFVGCYNAKICIFDDKMKQCSSVCTSRFFKRTPKRFDYCGKNRFACCFDDRIVVFDFLKERESIY
jgi:WD40 repeat protein